MSVDETDSTFIVCDAIGSFWTQTLLTKQQSCCIMIKAWKWSQIFKKLVGRGMLGGDHLGQSSASGILPRVVTTTQRAPAQLCFTCKAPQQNANWTNHALQQSEHQSQPQGAAGIDHDRESQPLDTHSTIQILAAKHSRFEQLIFDTISSLQRWGCSNLQ